MHNLLTSMRIIVGVSAFVITTACSSTTEATPGITVALAMNPTTVRPTDAAVVTLTIRNVSANAVAIQEACGPGTFSVGRIDGPPVALPDLACIDILRVTPLAAGEERVARVSWRNLTLEELVPTFALPAGRYRLRATVRYDVGNSVISAPIDVTVIR